MAETTVINGTDLISASRTTINTNFENLNTAIENGASLTNTVSFSTTPVFDASLGQVQELTLTGNVSASTIINLSEPQLIIFVIKQDATGGRTFTWPTNVFGAMTIDSPANTVNVQSFITTDGANLYATSIGVSH